MKRIIPVSENKNYKGEHLSIKFDNDKFVLSGNLLTNEIVFLYHKNETIEKEMKKLKEDVFNWYNNNEYGKEIFSFCRIMDIFHILDLIAEQTILSCLKIPDKREHLSKYIFDASTIFKDTQRTDDILKNLNKRLTELYLSHIEELTEKINQSQKKGSNQLTIDDSFNFPVKLENLKKRNIETVIISNEIKSVEKIYENFINLKNKHDAKSLLSGEHGDSLIVSMNALKIFREQKDEKVIKIKITDFLKKCGYDIYGMNSKTRSDIIKRASETLDRLSCKKVLKKTKNENGKDIITYVSNIFRLTLKYEPYKTGKEIKYFQFSHFDETVYKPTAAGLNYNLSSFTHFVNMDKPNRDRLIDACFTILVPFSYPGKKTDTFMSTDLGLDNRSIRDNNRRELLLNKLKEGLKQSNIDISENNKGEIIARKLDYE